MNSVSFFNGGDVHKKIFLLFPPVTWRLVFSRVCRQWRTTANSDALWNVIRQRVLERIPFLDVIEVDGETKEWCRRVYCLCFDRSRIMFKNLNFIRQVLTLNIPPSLVNVLELHDVTFLDPSQNVYKIIYKGMDVPNMYVFLKWSFSKLSSWRAFLFPIERLILYGYFTPNIFFLQRDKQVSRICVETLKIRRAKKRRKK